MIMNAREAYARFRFAWCAPFNSRVVFPSDLPAVLCFALIWPFGGGWKDVHMMAGTVTPAATGTVKYKTSENGNTELRIDAGSLAPPSSLTPPENAYVAWIQPPGQAVQNIGRLNVNDKEHGELDTKTAYKRFHIFITAEENAGLGAPQGPMVLSADVSQ
jgi:hypothetical protein